MRVLLRTDIGQYHGMGHASRMLALAKTLTAKKVVVSFITATPALKGYVAPYSCYDMLTETAPCGPGDVLVIDTKAQDWASDIPQGALWLARDAGLTVVRIDHPEATTDTCDLLIAPGNHWDTETVAQLRGRFGSRFLYGWDYVLLDPDVTALDPIPYQERERGPIVFCAGGSDPEGVLQRMFEATETLNPGERVVIFLQGHLTENPLDLTRVRHISTARMITTFSREWLRKAALLVTTFGQTCYEALWWQIPQLIVSQTKENELGAIRFDLETHGASCWLGGITSVQPSSLCQEIQEHLSYAGTMVRAAQHKVDGQGLERVATAILDVGSVK